MSKVKSTIKNSKVLKYLLAFFVFTLLILNLIGSQLISPLYFQFVSNNKQATVNFLEKIKTFPEFLKILEMNKNIYGKTVEEETFRQDRHRRHAVLVTAGGFGRTARWLRADHRR